MIPPDAETDSGGRPPALTGLGQRKKSTCRVLLSVKSRLTGFWVQINNARGVRGGKLRRELQEKSYKRKPELISPAVQFSHVA